MLYHQGIMDSLGDQSISEILESWSGFIACSETLLKGSGDLSVGPELFPFVSTLCNHGLTSLVKDHFLLSLEETFKTDSVYKFWQQFDTYRDASKLEMITEDWPQEVLTKSLEEICSEKCYQEKCLLVLVHALQSYEESTAKGKVDFEHLQSNLISRYQLMVSSVLLTTLPLHFTEILRLYFKKKLEELSTMMAGEYEDGHEALMDHHDFNQQNMASAVIDEMDIDESYNVTVISKNNSLVKSIGKVVRDLRNLGFTSLTEDAYASAIFLLLKTKVHNLAGDDYRSPVLQSIKEWIQESTFLLKGS